MLELIVDGDNPEEMNFDVQKLLLAGYTFRDQEQIRKHLEEEAREGFTASLEFPRLGPKLRDRITTSDRIEVLPNIKTSGEAEFVLLVQGDDIYIGIGSDHSDRDTEKYDMFISKQMCPCVISKKVWRYVDIKDHWDDIIKRAWVDNKGQRQLYQDVKLEKFMKPEDILDKVKERVEGDLSGTVIYAGTEAAIGGGIIYTSYFEAELDDKKTGKVISCSYYIEPINWFNGRIF
jgi:hypothetical protein